MITRKAKATTNLFGNFVYGAFWGKEGFNGWKISTFNALCFWYSVPSLHREEE